MKQTENNAMPHMIKRTIKNLIINHEAPLILFDPKRCRSVFSNEKAYRLLGRDIMEMVEDKERFYRHIRRSVERRTYSFKIHLRGTPAPQFRIDTSLIVLNNHRRLFLVVSDVSRSSQAVQRVKKVNEALTTQVNEQLTLRQSEQAHLMQQSRQAAMGEMIDIIAHQWKQPLNAISFYASMLRDDFRDELIDKAYIDDISDKLENQIDHLMRTMNEFRSFMHEEKEQQTFQVEEVLDSVLTLMQDELMKQHITLQRERFNLTLEGFPGEFKHLFINLISNAREAFEARKLSQRKLTVYLLREADRTLLCFRDNAGGIDPGVLPRIFEPRVTTKQSSGGTGMGLYLCRRIVEKHGGSIAAHLLPGGTLFAMAFPKKI